mmetsp:Transcript_26338/g.67119  ORF Transcript_26338/g.67119 Transcript_26338/m.67119 type:complete len:233 (+) Transcript_26338:5576-6274(+)
MVIIYKYDTRSYNNSQNRAVLSGAVPFLKDTPLPCFGAPCEGLHDFSSVTEFGTLSSACRWRPCAMRLPPVDATTLFASRLCATALCSIRSAPPLPTMRSRAELISTRPCRPLSISAFTPAACAAVVAASLSSIALRISSGVSTGSERGRMKDEKRGGTTGCAGELSSSSFPTSSGISSSSSMLGSMMEGSSSTTSSSTSSASSKSRKKVAVLFRLCVVVRSFSSILLCANF